MPDRSGSAARGAAAAIMPGGSWIRAAASAIAVLALGLAGALAAGTYVGGGSPAGQGRSQVAASDARSVQRPCKSGTCYIAVNVATVWARTVYRVRWTNPPWATRLTRAPGSTR